MTRHYWNDDWPYWSELYKAQNYIIKFYEKCTGKYMHCKEKYGTIRYEFTWAWIKTAEHCRIFKETIRRAVKKFPNVASEICSNAGHVLTDEFFEGWCAGVTFIKDGSYWSSRQRPNGV